MDVKHEVVLSYEITDTKAGDGETLPALLEQAEANLPADRIETWPTTRRPTADDVHKLLSGKGITPLIQMRACGRPSPSGCCRATTAPRTSCTTRTGRSIVTIR